MINRSATTDDIHELTLAEINRQVCELGGKRQAALSELISLERAHAAGHPPPAPLTDHGKAVRERAISMLNGHAASVLKFPPTVARENELRVEIDAIDVVTTALQKNGVAARAAEAVMWTESHRTEWVSMMREIVLTAIRLQAMSDRAREMLASAPDGAWGCDLPLIEVIYGGLAMFRDWDAEDPLREVRAAAISKNVITSSDIRKALQNV